MALSTAALREIAKTTLDAVSSGSLVVDGLAYDIRSKLDESRYQTAYYSPSSLLSAWCSSPIPTSTSNSTNQPTVIEFLETTTLDATRKAALKGYKRPLGMLNFASAEQPGGGFINGANAQEESLTRSSTLYASLMTPTAQQFHALHADGEGEDGFYSHAMVYSPHVVFFREDDGRWVPPMEAEVVTSAAVNAELVLSQSAAPHSDSYERIRKAMHERMARILFLFERRGVRNIVLGSFGTGVFRNDVDTVASIWAELLVGNAGRFSRSFAYVAFAILDAPTYLQFRGAFERVRRHRT
ncbi:unnamed protein product [Mycena citricolor]|uniref:Microbial-type PARG catalytic domain-containing protein n=1 Tax=Mycena citricolor TaxID=2018698 RepID=A0AAD2H2J1_9AGAR|nr:unnamed protein product [Mycena citricolor]CAK5282675.1 unnamed protein product [Mycena citricolor]